MTATPLLLPRLSYMPNEDAERFRLRAKQCRELSKIARDQYSRDTLAQMAVELDEEADKIDAEEANRPRQIIQPE